MTPILKIFYSLSQTIEKFAEINGLKIKVGRKPIVNDWKIASAFIKVLFFYFIYMVLL